MSAAVSLPTGILHLPQGIHRGVAESLYHAPCLQLMSNSGLKYFKKSPAHFRAWALGELEREETPAFRLGRACHCAVLEPARYAREYIAEPDFGDCRKTDETTKEQAKENKTRRDAWRKEHAGAPILTADEARSVQGMVEAVLAHPKARRCVEEGASEVTLRWTDPTGAECKARLDHHVPTLELACDLKSCLDATEDAFLRSIENLGYYNQDALYRRGLAATDTCIQHFAFVAVEKQPPYAVAIYTLDPTDIVKANDAIARRLDRFVECLAWDDWPSLPTDIKTISLRPWVQK